MMSSLNCAQDINKLDIYTQSSKSNQYRGGVGVTSSSPCGLVHHLNSRQSAAGTNFTPPPTSPQPHCIDPACAASRVAHSGNPIQCPNTIQQYCVQNIDVNNGGTILSLGGVTQQQAKCILDAATGTNQHINTNKLQTDPSATARRSPPDFVLPAAAIALVVVLLLLWGDED